MKVLVLGGNGMLGHKLWQTWRDRFDTHVTLRYGFESCGRYGIFDRARTVDRVSAQDFDSVVLAIAKVRPQVVVNCIGIVKQHPAAEDPVVSIAVNALFSHRLAQLCQAVDIRLIHVSTDCVFSGRRGNYTEGDPADAEDLYGRTKFLGEVSGEGCLTLRMSMIGRELEGRHGLIEWFLSQQGNTVRGYKNAIFTGFTTNALAEVIAQIITDYSGIHGIWHLASAPINKYDLLQLVKQEYGLDIAVEPDESVLVDRSLNADQYQKATGFTPPSWPDMIRQMYQDPTPYAELRRLSDH